MPIRQNSLGAAQPSVDATGTQRRLWSIIFLILYVSFIGNYQDVLGYALPVGQEGLNRPGALPKFQPTAPPTAPNFSHLSLSLLLPALPVWYNSVRVPRVTLPYAEIDELASALLDPLAAVLSSTITAYVVCPGEPVGRSTIRSPLQPLSLRTPKSTSAPISHTCSLTRPIIPLP